MRDDPEVRRVLDRFQLGLPRLPVAGRSGELLGRGTGSSVEFQEYREYLPGDDIRHLDWAAFARSDTLMVRLYREEISPRTEILVDASRSMTVHGGRKARLARQVAAAFGLLAARLGGRPSFALLDDSRPVRTFGPDELELLDSLPSDGVATLPELLDERQVPLRRQAVRIVISDFLFPHDPGPLLRRLAGDAGALWIVQVLTAWELRPEPAGGRRLVDAETAAETDLVIDRRAVAEYLSRLERLQEELARSCRRVHAPCAVLVADQGLESACRNELCAAGMLRPV